MLSPLFPPLKEWHIKEQFPSKWDLMSGGDKWGLQSDFLSITNKKGTKKDSVLFNRNKTLFSEHWGWVRTMLPHPIPQHFLNFQMRPLISFPSRRILEGSQKEATLSFCVQNLQASIEGGSLAEASVGEEAKRLQNVFFTRVLWANKSDQSEHGPCKFFLLVLTRGYLQSPQEMFKQISMLFLKNDQVKYSNLETSLLAMVNLTHSHPQHQTQPCNVNWQTNINEFYLQR